MRTLSTVVITLVTFASMPALGYPQAAPPAPVRRLVYSFTYGSQNNVTARDSANQAEQLGEQNSGMANTYSAALGDRGTMTVDVLREQPDKGLVVTIAEHADKTRSAPKAMCVVYGNTNVLCDPNKTVNPEEYTLLRFLASNFVDPTHIDDKGNWAVDATSGGMTLKADYHIVSNDNGVMTIDETRNISRANQTNVSTNVQTKIGYNFPKQIPTSIAEYVTQRQDQGVGGTSDTIYQTTLKLASDSMANTTASAASPAP